MQKVAQFCHVCIVPKYPLFFPKVSPAALCPPAFLPGRQPAGAAFAVLGSAAAAPRDSSRGMRHCCEGCLLLLFLTASLSLFISVIRDQNIPFVDFQDEVLLLSLLTGFFLRDPERGRCLEGNVCTNYCMVCDCLLLALLCVFKKVSAQQNTSKVLSFFA